MTAPADVWAVETRPGLFVPSDCVPDTSINPRLYSCEQFAANVAKLLRSVPRKGDESKEPHPEGYPRVVRFRLLLVRADEPEQPAEPSADAERERRIAEWEASALSEPVKLPGWSGDSGYPIAFCLLQSEIEEALALMRDRDAEVARLRAELDEREADMHIRIRSEYDKTVADSWRAEVERLTKQIATMDSARLVEQGLATSAEKRVAHLEGEIERLTKERDAGWEALERLRDSLTNDLLVDSRHDIEETLHVINKALAARPAQGKEGSDG